MPWARPETCVEQRGMPRTLLARPGLSHTSPRTSSVRPPTRSRPHVLPRTKARARLLGDSSASGSATSSRRRFASSYVTTSGCGTTSAGRYLTAEQISSVSEKRTRPTGTSAAASPQDRDSAPSRANLETAGRLRECDCPQRAARRAGQGKGEAGKREAMVWDFLNADEVLDDGNDVCRFKAERSGAQEVGVHRRPCGGVGGLDRDAVDADGLNALLPHPFASLLRQPPGSEHVAARIGNGDASSPGAQQENVAGRKGDPCPSQPRLKVRDT